MSTLDLNQELKDRVALITGGSSGIGLATALRFVQAGAKVALLSRHQATLLGAKQKIEQIFGPDKILLLPADVTQEAEVISAFHEILQTFGHLEILVNNAGSAEGASIEDTSLELWNRMMAVNCTGFFLVARETVRVFKRQGKGGAIVFVSSDNAIKPSRHSIAYNVSKSAELHMARCIAEECGMDNIRVNTVLPGAVFGEGVTRSALWTPQYRMHRASINGFHPDKLEEEYRKRSALRVIIEPEEVAEVILFLASDRSNKCTGVMFTIDGGGSTGYVR